MPPASSTLVSPEYIHESTASSQDLNPSYGYLWWINGQPSVLRGDRKIEGPMNPEAPSDMFAAQGALGRKCYVAPSRDLVVVRLGDSPERVGKKRFDNEFWRLLMLAAPSEH